MEKLALIVKEYSTLTPKGAPMVRHTAELLTCNIKRASHSDSKSVKSTDVDHAVLHTFAGGWRFAMNAARRAPRAQGIWGDSSLVASTTDLIKRVFAICCVLPLGLCLSFGWVYCPSQPEYDRTIGQVFG